MKPIKDRHDRIEHLLTIYPYCKVCGMKFEETPNLAAIRIMYPKFKGWAAQDIIRALQVTVHHRKPDTDLNCQKYPNFIHSDRNLLPLHALCHHDNKFFMFIGDLEAQKIETELIENIEQFELTGKTGQLEERV